ncbi:MAG: hypothetical protein IJ300_14385 [Clostridia bacterium]|nr:hypothetical protein [Clostridia bacterium]MBQ8765423.1 hypothetical protein [Clostridia bacterium]
MYEFNDNMRLRMMYYIRRNGEISLFDLCEKIFGYIGYIGSSNRNFFSYDLFGLYHKGFINIYLKTDEISDLSKKEEFKFESERHLRETLFAIIELYNSHENSFCDSSSETKVFISATSKLDEIQRTLGFSISNEFRYMEEVNGRNWLFGNIKNKLSSKVFVIMPFEDDFKVIYEDHIKKVCDKLQYSCQRADLIDKPNVIINDIWSLINNAEIIVCDCTGRNPNVFYELGLAHAIGKKVICITQNEEDIPFDIKQIRYIKYDYAPRGMEEFEKTLRRFMITDDISE